MSNIYTSAEQLIGRTPLLELSHIEKEYKLKAKIIAKLEYLNPAGSVKDRIAKAMIDEAKTLGNYEPVQLSSSQHRETQGLVLPLLLRQGDIGLSLLCRRQCQWSADN